MPGAGYRLSVFHNPEDRVICAKGFPWGGNFRLRYSPDTLPEAIAFQAVSEIHPVPSGQSREWLERQQSDVLRPPFPTGVPDLGESLRAVEGKNPADSAA
jgi:hypothetical protein